LCVWVHCLDLGGWIEVWYYGEYQDQGQIQGARLKKKNEWKMNK